MQESTTALQLKALSGEPIRKWEFPRMYVLRTDFFTEKMIVVLKTALSQEELEKSNRFRFVRDRNSYIVTHAFLRLRLGEFLNEVPEKIRMDRNFFGKPFLPDQPTLHFSLSHSHGVSVIAIDMKNEIGVDVEEVNPHFDYTPITARFFSADERNLIQSSDEKQMTFCKLWTKKEALLKGLGIGIGEDNLEVDVSTEFPAPPKHFSYDSQAERFVLKTLTFRDRHVISIAAWPGTAKVETYMPNGIYMLKI